MACRRSESQAATEVGVVAEGLASILGHRSDCPLQVRRGRERGRVQIAEVIRQTEPDLAITHLAEISLFSTLQRSWKPIVSCVLCAGDLAGLGDAAVNKTPLRLFSVELICGGGKGHISVPEMGARESPPPPPPPPRRPHQPRLLPESLPRPPSGVSGIASPPASGPSSAQKQSLL